MGKAIGSILNVITNPLSLIDRDLGNIVSGAALITIGVLSGNVALVAAGASRIGETIRGQPAQRADTTESAKKSPIPARTRAYGALRLYGDWILFTSKSDGTPVDVWAFHDGPANAITQVYLNDDKVTITGGVVQRMTDGRYRDDRVLAGYSMGLPTETAFGVVTAALPGIWTSDHRGDGVVTGYLIKLLTKSDKFLETYPNGDDIQMSLAGEWNKVYDFRLDGTVPGGSGSQRANDPTTWGYSENSLLAFLHFQMTQKGKDFATNILPQIDSWWDAADDCDDATALAAGGTEARYRLALAYKATETPAAVEAAILSTFDGWYCENERGELIVFSGRFQTPSVTLGPDQIKDYSFQEHVPQEDALNEVLITFVSAELDYATIDAPSWRDEAAISASGREPVSSSLEAQIPSWTQGRRLAKRKWIRANAPYRGSVTTTYGGRAVLGHRYIHLTIIEAGTTFYDGPVEITSSPERDPATGGIRFEWVAITAAIDAWNPAVEEGDITPPGEVPTPSPFLPDDLTGLSVSTNQDGSLIVADWDRSDYAERYLVEVIVEA